MSTQDAHSSAFITFMETEDARPYSYAKQDCESQSSEKEKHLKLKNVSNFIYTQDKIRNKWPQSVNQIGKSLKSNNNRRTNNRK